jgi:hypothetical protein
MLIAASIDSEKKILIIGLHKENIEKLLNDQPIEKDLALEGVPGLEEWRLYILGPEDLERFIAHYA